MLVSELIPHGTYPHLDHFVRTVLDDQFSDVRAMLQLPQPTIGIHAACNFAIVSSLCNLISGISRTIYRPVSGGGSGVAFKKIVEEYFPYTPPRSVDFADNLYKFCRNPMVHSVGVQDAASPVVTFTRIFHSAHDGTGWSDNELNDLENPATEYSLPYPGIVVAGDQWTIHCDSFYLDVVQMLRSIIATPDQATAAEVRFTNGTYNWRH